MTDWVRVKDKDTGHEYTVAFPVDGQEVIDKPAADGSNRPLPPKHNVKAPSQAATSSKEK